ncbi:hypothetical protein RA20_01185 [Leisingera sp. ANG-Vp]|nr:hypothetical protein RA20_01185 [Leisingera sp. ANG-Vp]
MFISVVSAAPNMPPGVPWPEDLVVADWQAVADALVFVSDSARATNARQQFEVLIEAHGLKRVQPDGSE